MFTRLLSIGSLFVSLVLAFGVFTQKAEASYYYDESYYNWPTPCYQYDGNGHCTSSGTRYRNTSERQYRSNGQYTYPNDNYYGNNAYYGNQYNRYDTYRPVTNYYRTQQNHGCYWYYGTYRCDRDCN
jgi:hypothetical protein